MSRTEEEKGSPDLLSASEDYCGSERVEEKESEEVREVREVREKASSASCAPSTWQLTPVCSQPEEDWSVAPTPPDTVVGHHSDPV